MAVDTLGFGPEDDPAYRYPDTTLYRAGTIKVNVTRDGLAVMASAERGMTKDRESVVEFLGHEIKHVEQYMQHPVQALSDAIECPLGYCSDAKLEDTKIKLSYELEAMRSGAHAAGFAWDDERKEIYFGYLAMYRPPVLARHCIDGKLSEDERAESRRFLHENQEDPGVLERMYPYLTPVFKRLKECLRH